MGSPVQFPRPSPPEETNQTLCVLVYFGRAHEDLGQKVGEWSTDGEERPGCAEVWWGWCVCCCEGLLLSSHTVFFLFVGLLQKPRKQQIQKPNKQWV